MRNFYENKQRRNLATIVFLSTVLAPGFAQHDTNYIRTVRMLDSLQSHAITSYQFYDGRGRPTVSATNGLGMAVLTNLSVSAHGWLYRPEWDAMRVTRRGPGVPAEWFACDIAAHFMHMRFR